LTVYLKRTKSKTGRSLIKFTIAENRNMNMDYTMLPRALKTSLSMSSPNIATTI